MELKGNGNDFIKLNTFILINALLYMIRPPRHEHLHASILTSMIKTGPHPLVLVKR